MIDIKERLRAFDSFAVNPKICKEAADHIATLEQENKALRVSLEAAVLHAQKGWSRSNTSTLSTDKQNVSINSQNIDTSEKN